MTRRTSLVVVALLAFGAAGVLTWRLSTPPIDCAHAGQLGDLARRLGSNYGELCLSRGDHNDVRARYTEPDSTQTGPTGHAADLALAIWRGLTDKPAAVRVQTDRDSDGHVDRVYSAVELRQMASAR